MIFETAKEFIRTQPGVECFAVDLDVATQELKTYLLWFDGDDPDDACFTVNYERGRLFSSSVQTGCFLESEVPNEVRAQEFYPVEEGLKDVLVTGLESEEVLFALLPNMSDPMLCVSDVERRRFTHSANRQLDMIQNWVGGMSPRH
ncbi:MAG: hypothetical protein ABW126_06675 [Candidatus Sedimenticola sp. 4PFRAG1]